MCNVLDTSPCDYSHEISVHDIQDRYLLQIDSRIDTSPCDYSHEISVHDIQDRYLLPN